MRTMAERQAEEEFRSTPPRGRRPPDRDRAGTSLDVSIHASAREATRRDRSSLPARACFDPRLREGGDPRPGLTSSRPCRFDPRLREGGDRRSPDRAPGHLMFRSTPPRGRRLAACLRSDCLRGVSIHASAREATAGSCVQPEARRFRSTPPRGRRQPRRSENETGARFRSTPPRGRRLSRAHVSPPLSKVSIHASVREATQGLVSFCVYNLVSIHASVREASFQQRPFAAIVLVSIHASVREATSAFRRRRSSGCGFDPRLREGGDRRIWGQRGQHECFDPRLPEGGDF